MWLADVGIFAVTARPSGSKLEVSDGERWRAAQVRRGRSERGFQIAAQAFRRAIFTPADRIDCRGRRVWHYGNPRNGAPAANVA